MRKAEEHRAAARMLRRNTVVFMRRVGETTIPAIAEECDATERDVQTALMVLVRSGLVRNTNAGRDKKAELPRYELWEQTIARMRDRSTPSSQREMRERPARGWLVA